MPWLEYRSRLRLAGLPYLLFLLPPSLVHSMPGTPLISPAVSCLCAFAQASASTLGGLPSIHPPGLQMREGISGSLSQWSSPWCPQVEHNSFSLNLSIKRGFMLFSADLWAWGARPGEMQCSKECSVGARPARVQIPKAARKLNLSVPQLPLLQNGVNKSIYLFGALWALNELIQAKCFEQCLAHSFYMSVCYRKTCFYLHIPVAYTVSISKSDFQMNEWMNECLGGCLYWLSPWPGKSYRTLKTLRTEKYLQKTSPAPQYF